MREFTTQQLADFASYERVRAGGQYNMFDPRARTATGLSDVAYRFVMEHYSALRDAYESRDQN